MNDDWSDEQTDNPRYADDRNFYKLEKWTKDRSKVDRLPYAGNNLDKARLLFQAAIKHKSDLRSDNACESLGSGRHWPNKAETVRAPLMRNQPNNTGNN